MFVDLVGSTALSARLDPEDMQRVLRAYQNAVAGEIARLEGHVAKLMGDGVLGLFRLARGARGRGRAGRPRRPRGGGGGGAIWPHRSGEPLAARVGIATGLVVVGDLIGEGAGAGGGGRRRDAQPRRPPAGARRARTGGRRRGHARAAGRDCSTSTTSARSCCAASPARSRAFRVLGEGRAEQPLRGAARRRRLTADGRARPGAGAAARALAAGRGGRGPGGAAGRRGRDRQVAHRAGPARRLGRPAAPAASLPMLALPRRQRALAGRPPARAGGRPRAG